MIFQNREKAGDALAKKLKLIPFFSPVVIALARGGAVVGCVIARELRAYFSLLCIQKITHPQSPEYAIGAITYSGTLLLNKKEEKHVSASWLKKEINLKLTEAKRRHALYLQGAPFPNIQGKDVILVDDGLATGLTMECAILDLRKKKPKKIFVAVPVASLEAANKITGQVEALYSLILSSSLGSIGEYYEDFTQVSDEKVLSTLQNPSIFS